jgi:hypothetical protein
MKAAGAGSLASCLPLTASLEPLQIFREMLQILFRITRLDPKVISKFPFFRETDKDIFPS